MAWNTTKRYQSEYTRDGQEYTVTADVWREGNQFVSQCVEYDIASQGDTVEDALASLRQAVELYFDKS